MNIIIYLELYSGLCGHRYMHCWESHVYHCRMLRVMGIMGIMGKWVYMPVTKRLVHKGLSGNYLISTEWQLHVTASVYPKNTVFVNRPRLWIASVGNNATYLTSIKSPRAEKEYIYIYIITNCKYYARDTVIVICRRKPIRYNLKYPNKFSDIVWTTLRHILRSCSWGKCQYLPSTEANGSNCIYKWLVVKPFCLSIDGICYTTEKLIHFYEYQGVLALCDMQNIIFSCIISTIQMSSTLHACKLTRRPQLLYMWPPKE